MKSTEYEMIVAQIAESLARNEGISESSIKWGKRNRWRGTSGFSHQIDVSIEDSHCIHLVECKCWNKRVPPEPVLALYGRLLDIRSITKKPVEGIIVSTKGFRSGAKQVASHYNIQWNIVESADEFGFKLGKQIVETRSATVATAVASDVIAEIDGKTPSR